MRAPSAGCGAWSGPAALREPCHQEYRSSAGARQHAYDSNGSRLCSLLESRIRILEFVGFRIAEGVIGRVALPLPKIIAESDSRWSTSSAAPCRSPKA